MLHKIVIFEKRRQIYQRNENLKKCMDIFKKNQNFKI